MNKMIRTDFGIIEYQIKQTSASRISIKVKNDGKVVLSVPIGVTLNVAEDFLKSKAKWVIAHSTTNKENYEKLQSAELNNIFILGKCYPILYKAADKERVHFENGIIFLLGDKVKALDLLKKNIIVFANEYFARRFEIIRQQLMIGENYKQVTRNVKSIWGSCDVRRKIIKLSTRLIAREEKSVDSVIYHELAHIKVQNHQKEFYKALLAFCPNYFSYQKAIKNSCYALTDRFILSK